jgi:hypothetical protein
MLGNFTVVLGVAWKVNFWVILYNTKLSYRYINKNFLHTNLFKTQKIFEQSMQNHYF